MVRMVILTFGLVIDFWCGVLDIERYFENVGSPQIFVET